MVDQILTAKTADPKADVSVLEAKIDQLVYSLYGLTPDKIRFVEDTGVDPDINQSETRNRDNEQVAGITDGD